MVNKVKYNSKTNREGHIDKNALTPQKNRLKYLIVICLMIITILLIVFFKWQKYPVEPYLTSQKSTASFAERIQLHTDQASRRNQNAFNLFKLEVSRIVNDHKPKLKNAAGEAAKEAADYTSCCRIIYYLAWDKARSTHETESYLDQEVKPFVGDAIQVLGKDMNSAVEELEHNLRINTVSLANDLAALDPSSQRPITTIKNDEMSHSDFQKALHNLGIDAVGINMSILFDAVAISKSQLGTVIWKKIIAIASRLFGKQVLRAGGSAAFAVADGLLPIGDIIAIGGIAWTGIDVYASQNEFEKELNISLEKMLNDIQNNVYKKTIKHAEAAIKKFQKLQDQIGLESLDSTVREGG